MKRFIIEDNEKVVKYLSKAQRQNLVKKVILSSDFFVLPWFLNPIFPGFRVYVKYFRDDSKKEKHPTAFGSCLPVGFIGRHAELVNLAYPELDEYFSKLRKIYYSVEKK